MTTQPIDYKSELERLPSTEREKYVTGWRDYLGKLPKGSYIRELTKLTRQFGPQFAGELIGPEPVYQKEPEAPTEAAIEQIPEPEVPWYQKPFAWAYEQPALKPLFEAGAAYQRKLITPTAMSVGTVFSPELRRELAGRKPFSIPEAERQEIWDEKSGLPWLAKTGIELAVDPTMYFGWGLAPKALTAATKAGMTGLAKAIKPIASAEEAYIRASALPVKAIGKGLKQLPAIVPDIAELWAAGKLAFRKPLEESARSVVRNLPTHAGDLLDNLGRAGETTGKPFSQILQDFFMGTPDEALTKTITSPYQKRALNYLVNNRDKLGLDELVGIADNYPETTAAILGQRLARVATTELGVSPPRILPGIAGQAQRILDKTYSLWKRTVLQTPFYVTQNTVENQVRQIMRGITPIMDITDMAKLPDFKDFPIDIQRRIISLKDRWNKTIPEQQSALFARTAQTGGATEAVTGSIAIGKTMPASTVAAYLDDMAIANTFAHEYYRIKPELLKAASAETRAVVEGLERLYDDALKTVDVKGVPVMEQSILDHLRKIAISGTPNDVIHAFQEVQRNRTMGISRAINKMEQSLPDAIRAKIKTELPRFWAKNDINGINRLFTELKQTLPQRIETYQKQLMVQRLRAYRDHLRASVPKQYQPYLTKILNRFKYERASEAEARLLSAKSLTEFDRAMFQAHVASRRELEVLAEWVMLTEGMAKNIPPETLATWFVISDEINRVAFNAGDQLAEKTFKVADVVKFAKDQSKVQAAWDSYITEIQSLAPDLAETMRQAAPNNDLLWHTYRGVQEQRWFSVGQEKLKATGIDINRLPKVIGADGKIITQNDFLQEQRKILEGWENRVITAWDKRHTAPTARNKLLDELREQTIRAKESISLQEQQISNRAKDMALDSTYATFGNYAKRTNLDEFMQGIGAPFWFFPSRSIPFYATQMIQKPRLGIEVVNLQRSEAESEQPSRIFGDIPIPGTSYWYNPLRSTMLWQLADQGQFTPAALGEMQQGMNWMRNNLAISLGPQWQIAATLVERVMGKQAGEFAVGSEPQPIIPQQKWLEAVAGLKLPGISTAAALLNEPFDMYLRAVYGDSVANWSQREVEKQLVDMGYNPQTAPKEAIQEAWEKYYTRQLLSIPGGAVKEMTPTELARFEAINQKAKDLGLDKTQRASLREAGESPFTGLRQDQLEAIYKDVPGQKLWRYIRPSGLTAKSKPIWDDYIQLKLGRETLLYGADKDNPTKGSRLYNEQQYDKALQSGRISPREWKALYRQSYANYIAQVQQLEQDFPNAPKTEADWEAYRQLLGWDEPVRHPDDIKLDEYYKFMDSSNFEDELGMFNYDAYRMAERQFFTSLSPETASYIQSRKDRYKSPLRAAYSRDMTKVQPYYDLQNAVLAQYPPEIAAIIDYASGTPDPAIQRAVLSSSPQAIIAMRKLRIAKDKLRAQNPELDRILRYWSS